MKITNINGTSDTICSCGSWLKHWANFSGKSVPYFCPVIGCKNTNLEGAHVQKENNLKWYICPLCKEHNQSSETLEIPNDFTLVSANKKETCEK